MEITKFNKVHFRSETCEWATPQEVFAEWDKKFAFTLDPCATADNSKCKYFFTKDENGLVQDWGTESVFMNPPYGREIGLWMKKAYVSAKNGATVVCLVPARTDTLWWHDFAMKGEIYLFKGRLKFGDAKNSAPFPSAVIVFEPLQQFADEKLAA